MPADAKNVTQGKPKVGGAIHIAPDGTTVPTDATTALNAAFKNLGYVTTDGVTNSNSTESSNVTAWGGDTVLNTSTSKTDTFQFSLMESLNVDVLKMVYGDDNVTGTLSTGITVKANSADTGEHPIVIEMIQKGGYLKRIVIPNGKVTAVGDIVYKDDEATSYNVTVSASPDSDGNTHYEYIKTATASSGGGNS